MKNMRRMCSILFAIITCLLQRTIIYTHLYMFCCNIYTYTYIHSYIPTCSILIFTSCMIFFSNDNYIDFNVYVRWQASEFPGIQIVRIHQQHPRSQTWTLFHSKPYCLTGPQRDSHETKVLYSLNLLYFLGSGFRDGTLFFCSKQ